MVWRTLLNNFCLRHLTTRKEIFAFVWASGKNIFAKIRFSNGWFNLLWVTLFNVYKNNIVVTSLDHPLLFFYQNPPKNILTSDTLPYLLVWLDPIIRGQPTSKLLWGITRSSRYFKQKVNKWFRTFKFLLKRF